MKKFFKVVILSFLALSPLAGATEVSAQVHSGSDADVGYGFTFAGKIADSRAFSWSTSYTGFSKIQNSKTGDADNIDLEIIDVMIGVTHKPVPRYYYIPSFYQGYLVFDGQVGVGMSMTDNRVVTEEDASQFTYLSEKGDISLGFKVEASYFFHRRGSVKLGYKHFNSIGNFETINSIYIGLGVKF